MALGSAWFGPSAVVVFFVVSGFCVHGPHIKENALDLRSFIARRYIRILVPLAAILPIGAALGVNYAPYGGWVTWSLICEVVYYAVYPALRALAMRYGWLIMIATGYAIGYLSVLVWAMLPETPVTTVGRDILSNAPVWMLGCWLAEICNGATRPDTKLPFWAYRILVMGTSFTIGLLHYSNIVGSNWTLPAFGLIVTYWLLTEIRRNADFSFLSKGGAWSYSLYLVHPAALFGLSPLLLSGLPIPVAHALSLGVAVVASYIFYLAIEKPSHMLARAIGANKAKTKDHVSRTLAS